MDDMQLTTTEAPMPTVETIEIMGAHWRMFLIGAPADKFHPGANRALCRDECKHATKEDAAACLVAQVEAARIATG